jgi:hypothetical protein
MNNHMCGLSWVTLRFKSGIEPVYEGRHFVIGKHVSAEV